MRFLLAIVCISLLTACSTSPSADAPSSPATSPHLMVPDLVGLALDDAWDALRADRPTYDVWNHQFDLSVLHRDVNDMNDATVVATVPPAGAEIDDDEPVSLFVLRESEYAWFNDHRRMPRIAAKGEGWDLTDDDDGVLADVEDLVEFRYVPSLTPSYAQRTRFWPKPDSGLRPDLSAEPASERRLRSRYREAKEYDLVVRTAQRPGSVLRPGQIITVLVRPPRAVVPEVYPDYVEEDWDWDVDAHYDDDDDFNVPGWLCPTRFC